MAKICIREEHDGDDYRYMYAWITGTGELVLYGVDGGPSAYGEGDEYEWNQIIQQADIPALIAALGGDPHGDPLEQLAEVGSGKASHQLSALLREKVVPSTFKPAKWSEPVDTGPT